MAQTLARANSIRARIETLLEDIRDLVRLEEESQVVLKQPVEQMLDSASACLTRLEEQKTRLMRQVDRHSTEYFEARTAKGAQAESAACADLHQRLMQALRSLQRLHQDNERILQLRMTLLSEDMRSVERSRQFLRSTLQAVAA